MANYYSKVRAGKTIRERLELLLEADPYKVSHVAPSREVILPPETEYNPREHFAEPLVYDYQKPEEVREFFTALLEIFSGDREEKPKKRRMKEATKWHEVIDELEKRFALFKGKADNSDGIELTTVKATAKSALDSILEANLQEFEQELKSIGVNTFHSVNRSPQAIATYITDELEKHRQKKKREQIQGKLTQIEKILRILDPTRPDFIHRRFFQAFVGYKCEELKQAIENYNPQKRGATSSLEQVPEEWPLREEFFEWLRGRKSPVQLLLLACRVNQFDPYWGMRSYQQNEVTELLKRLTGRTALREFSSSLARIHSKCNSLDKLGALLVKKPGGATAFRLLNELKNAPINAEARESIDHLLLLRIN
jgi:hypothetical protein